jgi:hypothetical protein
MKFVVERIEITDVRGALTWSAATSPLIWCDADGADASSVLAGIVTRDGATQVSVAASFTNGQAITLAQKGQTLYALRAVPS